MDRNCFGKRIKQTDIVADNSFLDKNGQINWSLIVGADKHGFDLSKVMENGEYVVRDYILPKGSRIVRYGDCNGHFTAPYGTPYEKLSLPYLKETRVYHEYIVRRSCKVKCVVMKGYVAKGFSSEGGAIQYFHKDSIYELVVQGVLKEDFRWLIKALLKM
jgi:hypothetical protein